MMFGHLQRSHYWLLGAICMAVSLVALSFGHSSPHTAYLMGLQSPWYTPFTTHLSHHSWLHAGSNLLALAMLLYLFPVKIKHLLMAGMITTLVTAVYVQTQHIEAYLGLSAWLYCIPGCYLGTVIRQGRWRVVITMLAILLIHLSVVSPLQSNGVSGWQPMSSAHLLGLLAGLMSDTICVQMSGMRNRNIQSIT